MIITKLHKLKLNKIYEIATIEGWLLVDWQEGPGMVSYRKEDMRVNVYISTMTVGSCLAHPRKGKTQLFRKAVNMGLLKQIFQNPRIHTNKGYIKKR